jgi:hypothetical protein
MDSEGNKEKKKIQLGTEGNNQLRKGENERQRNMK